MAKTEMPVWRHWAFLVAVALIPVFMVTLDGVFRSIIPELYGVPMQIVGDISKFGYAKYPLRPTAAVFILLMLLYFVDANTVRARVLAWIAAASGFIFTCVTFSGLVTLIIKAIVGRARPRYTELMYWPDLQPFAFSGGFLSFPSGHANSAFATALAVGYFAPRLRPYLLVFATAIAFCRVLQSQHFFSDVVAGSLLAIATTTWLRDLFARNDIVFHRYKDGRLGFTAPGRLFVRWCKARLPWRRGGARRGSARPAAGRG